MKLKKLLLSVSAACICFGASFAPIPMTPKIDVYSPSSGNDALSNENPFGNDALMLSGNISNASGSVTVSLSDKNGNIYQSVDAINGQYSLYFPEISSGSREHILIITVDGKKYYYDFETDSYNTSEYIQWDESNHPTSLNMLELNSTASNQSFDFDISQLDSNKNIISGSALGAVMLVATDTVTGKVYVFDVADDGSFEMKFLNTHTSYILKLFTEDQNLFVQNDGTVGSSKNIVNVINDNGIELANVEPVIFDHSQTFNIDINSLEENSLSGTIITQTAFTNTSFDANGDFVGLADKMKIVLYDADDGSFLTQAWTSCNNELCSYDLDLGSAKGEYIVEVYQNIEYDGTRSYSGVSYYLLSDDTLRNTNFMSKDMAKEHARTIASGENTININMQNYTEDLPVKFSGSFDMSSETGRVYIMDPKGNRKPSYADIQFGKFETTLLPGEYIVSVEYSGNRIYLTDDDGYYSSGIRLAEDTSAVFYDADDNVIENLREFTKNGGQFAYLIPKDVKLLKVENSNITMPKIALEDITYLDLNVTVPDLDNYIGKSASMELFGNGITKRFVENLTIGSASETFAFKGLLARDDYNLKLTIDGNKALYYDSSTDSWSDEGYFKGYQNGSVCEDIQNRQFNCLSSLETNYLLNFTPFTVDSTSTKIISLPARNKISGSLSLASYPNTDVNYITTGNQQFIKSKTTSDAQGIAGVSVDVKPADGYVMQVQVDKEWYFIDHNTTTNQSKLISVRNGYDAYGYQKESIKLDVNESDLDLGTVVLAAKQTVQFSVSNLDQGEKIFISLKGTGDEGWYGAKESANDSGEANISFSVPAGDYTMGIYPSIHKSGMIQDADMLSGIDLTNMMDANVTWAESNASVLNVSENRSINLQLPANAFINFSGKITTLDAEGNVVDATGDICVRNFNTSASVGSCGKVNSSGYYSISRLMPSQDDVYALRYSHKNRYLNKLKLSTEVVMSGTDMENVDFTVQTASGTISGTVEGAEVGDYISLLQVRNNTAVKTWEKIRAIKVTSSNMDFTFDKVASEPGGYSYEIAIAKPHINPRTGEMTLDYSDLVNLSGQSGIAEGITADSAITIQNITQEGF
jgi:hypothetical protein